MHIYVCYLLFADVFIKSTIATSGGILLLIIIPVIMLTVICCLKKKSNAKVLFTKCDGTFKVTIAPNYQKKYGVHQQNKSPNCTVPNRNNQNKQKLDQAASIGSDVVMDPNPSYDVAKSVEEKFTLSESLYIYCGQLAGDETVEKKSSKQQAIDGKRKDGKALYGPRECNNALLASHDVPPSRSTLCNNGTPPVQIFEDSIQLQQTVNAAREECDNTLYEAREYSNALSTGDGAPVVTRSISHECDNALYEVTLHVGNDVTMKRNPSYNMIPTASEELTFQNSYEYVAPLTSGSPTQQNDGTTECDDDYDYVDEIFDDDSSHDYSSIEASDDEYDNVLSTKDNTNSHVTNRRIQNPSYGRRKVTVLKKIINRSSGSHPVTTVQEVAR